MYCLHKDLIKLRREDPVFRQQRRGGVDGAVLSARVRFCCAILAASMATGFYWSTSAAICICDPAPEPLLAPRIIRAGPSFGRVRIPDTAATAPIHRRAKTIGGCLEIPPSCFAPNQSNPSMNELSDSYC